jgi:hypothetical protein
MLVYLEGGPSDGSVKHLPVPLDGHSNRADDQGLGAEWSGYELVDRPMYREPAEGPAWVVRLRSSIG